MDIDEIRNKLREVADKQFKILKRYEKYKAKADEEERKLKALEKLYDSYTLILTNLRMGAIDTVNAVIVKNE